MQYKKIGEICEIICGQDYKSVLDENGKYPIYGTGGGMGYANNFRCPENTVIIGRKGSINNPLFVEEKFWNVDTAFGVVPNIELVVPKYFYYFCKDYDFTKHDVSVTIPSLRRTDIVEIPVPVPSLSSQSRIVSELDLLTSLIDNQKKQLDELSKLQQSTFYSMFGDPVENEKEWPVKKLGECVTEDCSLSYGIVQPGDDVINGVPVVRPVDLIDTYVYLKGLKRTKKEISDSYKRTILQGNELLMCVRGTTGVVAMASEELYGCNTTRGIVPIRFSHVINKLFGYNYMTTPQFRQIVNDFTYGATLQQINITSVRQLPIILPPLPLQTAFAEKISAIEEMKKKLKASIAETQKMFDARMQEIFG